MKNIITATGQATLKRFASLSYALGMFARILKESFLIFGRSRVGIRVLVMQILFTGVEALRIVAIAAMALGAAIILIGTSLLGTFGQSKLMYTILILVITHELGPLITAFVVTARSGTAISTELGTMVVAEEMKAYIAFGVNPISFLAAPRLIGVTLSMLVLFMYFNLFGLIGSFAFVQLFKPIGVGEYFRNLFDVFVPLDIASGLVKSAIFGLLISFSSIYHGFAVRGSSTEIPVAGIKAVSTSFVLCVCADIILTIAFYI